MSTPKAVTPRVIFPPQQAAPASSRDSLVNERSTSPQSAASRLFDTPTSTSSGPSTVEERNLLEHCKGGLADHAETCRKLGDEYDRSGRLDEAMDMWLQLLVIAQRYPFLARRAHYCDIV